jgi:hypothetical protein
LVSSYVGRVSHGPPMPPRASLHACFSKPTVLRDDAPLATLDEARALLAKLSPAQVTPALYYAMHAWRWVMRSAPARHATSKRLGSIS